MKILSLIALLCISTAILQAMQDSEEPISPEFNYFDKLKFARDYTYDNGVAITVFQVSARHIPSMRIYMITIIESFFEKGVTQGYSYQQSYGKLAAKDLDEKTAENIFNKLYMATHSLTPAFQKKDILDELHKLIKDSAKKSNYEEKGLSFLQTAR